MILPGGSPGCASASPGKLPPARAASRLLLKLRRESSSMSSPFEWSECSQAIEGRGSDESASAKCTACNSRTGSARMDLGRIDLNLLRVLDVIHEERNLVRAGLRLHLSQSAVSHALARLRETLGDELFVRTGRG